MHIADFGGTNKLAVILSDVKSLHKIGVLFAQYLLVGLCITSVYYVIHLVNWPNTRAFILATSTLSIFVSTLATAAFLIFYYFKRERLFLVIALTTVGCTVFVLNDVIPSLYSPQLEMGHQGHIPEKHDHNNHMSHLFLGLMMAFGYFQEKISDRYSEKDKINIIILASSIFFLLTIIEQSFIENTSSHHLAEIVSGITTFTTLIILSVAFFCFLFKGDNGPQTVGFWLVFYIAANFYLHIPSFEQFFKVPPISATKSGLYSISTYLILLSGLIYNSLWIISKETETRRNLTKQNKAIELLYMGGMIIADSEDFETATSQCLERLVDFGHWELAHAYFIDNNDDSFQHYWCGERHEECQDFKAITMQLGIDYGVGFSGKVWERKKHLKIKNIERSSDFLRKKHALEAGLHSALAFPITHENKLVALLELYSTKDDAIDEGFTSATNNLCHQLENLYAKEQRIYKLVAREKLLNELFDSFPSGMATFDEHDHLAIFNQRFVEANSLYGLEIHKNMDFHDWVTTIAYSGHIEEAFGREQEWIEQQLAMHKYGYKSQDRKLTDGSYLRFSEIPLESSGTVCIWTDVTEIKRNKIKKNYMFEMLKTSLTSFPGGVCIFDASLKIVTYNNAMIKLLALSSLDITEGASFSDFLDVFRRNQNIYNEFITQLSSLHAKVAKTGKPQSDPSIIIDDKVFMLHMNPLKTGGFVLILTDITNTQNSQVHFVNEFDPAEISIQAKSEIFSELGHDLRTPLNGVLTSLELLRDTKISSNQSKHIETISNSALSLMKILNDNQDLSKIKAGELVLDLAPVCTNDIVHYLQNICTYQAGVKGITFSVNRNIDLIDVINCDFDKLLRILTNLVDNAVKNTSEGVVSVSISQLDAKKTKDEYTKLRFEITDTGNGLSKAHYEILTEDHLHLNRSLTLSDGGSGVGLKLAKNLVDLMGGLIKINNDSISGTAISFDLKVGVSNWKALEKAGTRFTSKTSEEFESDPLYILVAEDHPISQTVLKELLTRWGHEITIVENGEQAVAAVATCKYDLVLMDIQMPEMDGYTAALEIRKLPGRVKDIPIIALTANAMYGERKR